VPGQQRARRHDPVQPQAPGQQPCQGGEHGTVSPVGRGRETCRRSTALSCRRTRSPRPWRRHSGPGAPASRTPGPRTGR
jgi:hypothetical protein